MEVFLGILAILHMILAWQVQKKINQTNLLNPFQKRLNSFLTWTIPFIWGIIVKSMIKPSQYNVITKKERRRKIGKHTDNWDQLTGGGLGGHRGSEN